MTEPLEPEESSPRPGFAALLGSVLAAAFGVQSDRNRKRDFSGGNYRHFLLAGVVFTALFVLGLALLVKLVLNHAGV